MTANASAVVSHDFDLPALAPTALPCGILPARPYRPRDKAKVLDGAKEHMQCFVSVQAPAQLGGLARYHDYSLTDWLAGLGAQAI